MRTIDWIGTMVCALVVLGLVSFVWWIEPREVVVVEVGIVRDDE